MMLHTTLADLLFMLLTLHSVSRRHTMHYVTCTQLNFHDYEIAQQNQPPRGRFFFGTTFDLLTFSKPLGQRSKVGVFNPLVTIASNVECQKICQEASMWDTGTTTLTAKCFYGLSC